MPNETYNGWRNRATWNVALWVGNDEALYREAVAYVERRRANGRRATWGGFVRHADLGGERTPDGFAFDGSRLDYSELTAMLNELVD
jgi:hypothetical protein